MNNTEDNTTPPPTPPETTASPLLNDDGAFAPGWFTRFEELQPFAATLSKFQRPEALAKSYANLEKLRGYPDTADAARMAAFRAAVGLPPKAEEFTLERPQNTPDELWDENLVNQLSGVAYEYGVPPKAMAALAERYTAENRRFLERCQQENAEAVARADATLQQDWGSAYEQNMQTIERFLHTMGERAGVNVQQLAENPALRANPDFARLMLEAAGLMDEAPLHTGQQTDQKKEAHRIAHDPTHPLHEAYMRTSHPQHRYANEQYDRLAFGRKL
ncbi:MAG: hypothetical protein J6J97_03910 [Akkermansia sp.]|nr:hypothetical protein [Akkermansia sp.]MBQ2869810.1 hypothetical protein [Akkermansia sp.]MBQ8377068.1 hypothetical protein [Akkermansia sp.]